MISAKNNGYFGTLTDDEKLFVSKIEDLIYICEEKYIERFTFFIDSGKKALCESVLGFHKFSNFLFYGGYDGAERTVLGLYPSFSETDESKFPIVCIRFGFSKFTKLTHKDFLGALMSYNIKRDTIGDILVNSDANEAYVYVYATIAEMILSDVNKIGSSGVSAEIFDGKPIVAENKFSIISGTVASLRTDAVVSLVTKLSREKACSVIQGTGIDINYKKCYETDKPLKTDDVFSIRGYGKFILDKIGGISKKGRIHISVKKYI